MSPATIYWFGVVHIAIIVKFEQTFTAYFTPFFSVSIVGDFEQQNGS